MVVITMLSLHDEICRNFVDFLLSLKIILTVTWKLHTIGQFLCKIKN